MTKEEFYYIPKNRESAAQWALHSKTLSNFPKEFFIETNLRNIPQDNHDPKTIPSQRYQNWAKENLKESDIDNHRFDSYFIQILEQGQVGSLPDEVLTPRLLHHIHKGWDEPAILYILKGPTENEEPLPEKFLTMEFLAPERSQSKEVPGEELYALKEVFQSPVNIRKIPKEELEKILEAHPTGFLLAIEAPLSTKNESRKKEIIEAMGPDFITHALTKAKPSQEIFNLFVSKGSLKYIGNKNLAKLEKPISLSPSKGKEELLSIIKRNKKKTEIDLEI